MQPWTAASSTSDDSKSKCCGLANAKRVTTDNVAKRRLQTSRHSRRIKGLGKSGGKEERPREEGGGARFFSSALPFSFPISPIPPPAPAT